MERGAGAIAEVFASILFAPGTPASMPGLVEDVQGWMEATPPAGLSAGLLAMRGREDYTGLLPSIRVPAIVVGADSDQAIPPDNSRLLAERVPSATLCMIPGAGHMVNMEQPEAFNACLLDFLQRCCPPGC